MSSPFIIATPDSQLRSTWEAQIPRGCEALRIGEEGLQISVVSGLNAVVVLDAVLESTLPAHLGGCSVVYVGEPRSIPFENARRSGKYKCVISYEDSRTQLRDILPLVAQISEQSSLVEILQARAAKVAEREVVKTQAASDSAEVWEFIESAIDCIENKERLIAEFRRGLRYLLRASHSVFFLRDPDGFRADRGTSFFPVEDPLVRFLEMHPAIVDVSQWDGPSNPSAELSLRNRMALWGARLLVPIHDNARLLGVIALGVRNDGLAYDDADRRRAVVLANMFKGLLSKSTQFGRLNQLATQASLGARYLPGTLVLGADESVPRHVPFVVRDLIGQVRRTKEACRSMPCPGQPFRVSAGVILETGGVWAFWEEASWEVHDVLARERSERRELLREIALTLSHELGNSLVSLATFRQVQSGRTLPSTLIDTIKQDIAHLEGLSGNLSFMQRLHEAEPEVIDIREVAASVGKEFGVRVEVGPDAVLLKASGQLLTFAIAELTRALLENRAERENGLMLKVRSSGNASEATALISVTGANLELEGVLPEPREDDVPNQGRLGVFLAKEILRLHNGEIHAGPGIDGTEILVSFKNY